MPTPIQIVIVGGVAGGMSAATRPAAATRRPASPSSKRPATSPSPIAACPITSMAASLER